MPACTPVCAHETITSKDFSVTGGVNCLTIYGLVSARLAISLWSHGKRHHKHRPVIGTQMPHHIWSQIYKEFHKKSHTICTRCSRVFFKWIKTTHHICCKNYTVFTKYDALLHTMLSRVSRMYKNATSNMLAHSYAISIIYSFTIYSKYIIHNIYI